MRLSCLVLAGMLAVAALFGCARHTYYVELANGKYFYVDPPLIFDKENEIYYMRVNGVQKVFAMDEVSYIDDAAQICFQNVNTDTSYCVDSLYHY
jgi:hypothetical protein